MQSQFFRNYIRPNLSAMVKNVYKELEKHEIYISGPTLDHISDKAEHICHSQKKNATAFILGFHVYDSDTNKINKTKLKHVLEILPKLDVPLIPEDILRYARLLMY